MNFVCERCRNTSFTIYNLTKEEIEEKLKDLDYKKPRFVTKKIFINALVVGYTYVKCSKCNWGKFVKNMEI